MTREDFLKLPIREENFSDKTAGLCYLVLLPMEERWRDSDWRMMEVVAVLESGDMIRLSPNCDMLRIRSEVRVDLLDNGFLRIIPEGDYQFVAGASLFSTLEIWKDRRKND